MSKIQRATVAIEIDQDRRRLLIDWNDGQRASYPYIWLRHACFFPLMGRAEQRDPRESRLPEDPASLSIASTSLDANALIIHWAHDDQPTYHDLGTLQAACRQQPARHQRNHQPLTWQADDASRFHWFAAGDLEQPQTRLQIFSHLRDYGIALVRDLSIEPGTLNTVARHLGPVRQTHFGSLFNIRSQPVDNIGTGQAIGATASNSQAPHTDEGWRHGPPGINLFHCLKAHPQGGESIFVDGIGAAAALRETDIEAFRMLSEVPVLFVAERNSQERFRTRAHCIALDSDGCIRGIRISDRTLPALDLPVDQIESAYRALRQFYRLLLAPERTFEYRLNPGELVLFDNHRVLHGRRAFDPQAGERWLQQLSVDREEFHNRYRILAEAEGRADLADWNQDAGALS